MWKTLRLDINGNSHDAMMMMIQGGPENWHTFFVRLNFIYALTSSNIDQFSNSFTI